MRCLTDLGTSAIEGGDDDASARDSPRAKDEDEEAVEDGGE